MQKVYGGETSTELSNAFIAAKEARSRLVDYEIAGTFSKALAKYEAGQLPEAEYQKVLREYQALKKAFNDALSYYHSLGGTVFIPG
jgi:hypothetical protein